jgi:hypothetical protein
MEPNNNPFEELELFVEPKAEEKAAVIADISNGKYSLSFSALTAFAISPYAFIAYKVQESNQTPAMLMGEVVHCRLLEPDEFDKRYRIAPNVNASTVEGKNAWAEIFEEMTEIELPRNKAGNAVIPKISELIKQIKEHTAKRNSEGKIIVPGITVIPGKVAEEGDFRARRLLKNRASRWVIDQLTETEMPIEFELDGVKIRGRVDGKGSDLIMDIKNVVNAELHAASYAIKSRKLHWQAWAYSRATGIRKYYICCVDGRGEVSVHLVSDRMLDQAEIEVAEYVERFKDLAMEGMFDPSVWEQSQDFWLKSPENPYGLNLMP